MKLVAGLGNPGSEYHGTRHNVGFEVLDLIAREKALEWRHLGLLETRWRERDNDVLLVKPQTFMNLSGAAVSEVVRYRKITIPDILIVCDDVNLPLGRLRARASGSEGGHNGLRSVAEQLGTNDYARLRVGVGRGDPRWDLADHVLSRFDESEVPVIRKAVERAAEAIEMWVTDGLARMMTMFNREPEPLS